MASTVTDKPDTEGDYTVSMHFDKIYKELMSSIHDPEPSLSLDEQDANFQYFQIELEKITNAVSAMDLFSPDEYYEEIAPAYLKFLMLPYLLGTLWTLKDRAEQRKQAIQMAQIYFKDYLDRLFAHGIILIPAPILREFEDPVELGDGDRARTRPLTKNPMTPEEKRRRKIARFRETKELEQKVDVLQRSKEDNLDETTLNDIWLLLIRKSAIDAENQLESILKETELLLFGEARAQGKNIPAPRPVKALPNAPPFSLFMITKTELQKQVFGAGYPSLPIMTVDELYEQRRQDGTWGPPPGTNQLLPAPGIEETDSSAEREAAEDMENPADRLRQLELDDYKDTHRRGWGNRHNRS